MNFNQEDATQKARLKSININFDPFKDIKREMYKQPSVFPVSRKYSV